MMMCRIGPLVLMLVLLLAACEANDPCADYTCNNGGTCVNSQPTCDSDTGYFRGRFLICYRDKNFCARPNESCSAYCAGWMGCSGNLAIDSDGVLSVLGPSDGYATCQCATGFQGLHCETAPPDASQTSDLDTSTDSGIGDEAGAADPSADGDVATTAELPTEIGDASNPDPSSDGDVATISELPTEIGDVSNPDPSSDGDVATTPEVVVVKKMIFVTAGAFDGNLGGPSGADTLCGSDANRPASGTFKALLADGATRRACVMGNENCLPADHLDWVMAPDVTYVRTDGSTVIGMTSSAGVIPFSNGANLTNSIGTSEVQAFTGMSSDWSLYNGCGGTCNCAGFLGNSASDQGPVGAASATNHNAIGDTTIACSATAHLYCVEQ